VRPGALASSRFEAAGLLGIALLTTLLFASGTLDIAAARAFYRPDPLEHWPLAQHLPWSLLYRAAPLVTATLVLAGLVALALGLRHGRSDLRQAALLLLLGVALGPGLLANGLFKDHWQHPRPRDLLELGGPLQYVASPMVGSEGGASFPCGHCSVGFMYAAGWWIWKRRRPNWAAASLGAGITLGLVLGIGRMAAGAHFLSDILWSALLAFAVLHILWYHVLPAGAAEQPPAVAAHSRWHRLGALAGALAGVGVLIALFATPHGNVLTGQVPLHPGSPRTLEVVADTANVSLVLLDGPAQEIAVAGELHGFGLPGSRLTAHFELDSRPQPALRYRIESRGRLTDVDGMVTLRVPAGAFDSISVDLRRGNIRLTDLTRSRAVSMGRIHLDLHTLHGRVQAASP
jgi:lipid A 4'-phosphatase